eukprot:TRINITY_DN54307_c0_g1_i1.p1 TRINITY_DN54307_c0_g1~~TRINITY_DN54307_c0_g1_i1.p1  ORF type:complete len:286 (-),score=36.91 TRINITY_DN54307_c0_g1_i1:196-1053(-)
MIEDSGYIGNFVQIQRAKYGCHRGDRLRVNGSSAKLWKLDGGKTIPKDHMGTGWTWVPSGEDVVADALERILLEQSIRSMAQADCPVHLPAEGESRLTVACVDGYFGYVIDGALDDAFLEVLDATRLSLPLDTSKKKTAAARRFHHDADGDLRVALQDVLLKELPLQSCSPVILPWMRFLEYLEPEGALPPHTDAIVHCKETGQTSTHTLLVYSSGCEQGGETVMLPWPSEDPSVNVGAGFAVRPLRGRIFCFPHGCLHEGAPTDSVPKVLLRAELILPQCVGRL